MAKTVGGDTTRFLVDELNPTGYLQVLEELSTSGVQTRYTYGDALVSQARNVSSAAATSYYGYDAHGNITFLTDGTGAVTNTYDYDTFGTLVEQMGSTPNSRLFDGEEFDPDLGLINLRARQYKPGAGRFLEIDPAIGDPESPLSFNRYLYASGDSVNRWDPTGLTTLLEYSVQFESRVYSIALHSGHHAWTILGIKVFCLHLQFLTYLEGVSGSGSRFQLPLFPLCKFTKF